MTMTRSASTGAWRPENLETDDRWIVHLDDTDRTELLSVLRQGQAADRPLMTYRRTDFPFRERTLSKIRHAMTEAQHGLGVALLKGLPREQVSPAEFALLTWAIGLHLGVARPQDKASRYLNTVMDAGSVYRSATGRGYSSNAELDFHVDGADVVCLTCYNQAPEGGDSMCASSVAAYWQLKAERPDLAEALEKPYPFGRQGEQAAGEAPYHIMPIVSVLGDAVFCLWVRNRLEYALQIPGAPVLTQAQREAVDLLDEIVRRPEFMYRMRLEPGDMQILGNHTVLHSRTEFHDHADPARKRTLFRLWLSTPDAPELPAAWVPFYGSTAAGTLRGGIYGQQYDDRCREFDRVQGADMDMRLAM